jgi:hypothetical protein
MSPDTTLEPATARRLRDESLTDSWLSARLGVDKGRLDAMRRNGGPAVTELPPAT